MLILLALAGAYELALPEGGEAVVNLVLENQTDTALKEPWIFVFSKPDWLSVSPDSVITGSLAKGEKIELQLRIRAEGHDSWIPWVSREGELKLRVLVRNGEVAPDFIDFKVKEEPAEFVSLIPLLISREYGFTHTLTEHYDYYPIVFLHGMNATARSWLEPHWEGNYDDSTALEKLLDSKYQEYEAGEPLIVYPGDESSIINRTHKFYPKRVAYSCGYYLKTFEPGEDERQGVIGSGGLYWICDLYSCVEYRDNQQYGEYSQRITSLVDAICEITYSDKVNVVAHSMGGYVLRAAIKYYNCDKINRVLMIGTPNKGCHYSNYQETLIYLCDIYPEWMQKGEGRELGIGESYDISFCQGSDCSDNLSGGVFWYDLLNQGNWPKYEEEYAVIAGNLGKRIEGIGPADGVVDVWWVRWDPAKFNVTHRSSHSSDPSDWFNYERKGEISLIANEFTTEYIKTWIIDGKEDRVGKPNISESQVILPSVWEVYDNDLVLTIEGSINDFLSIQVVLEEGGVTWEYSAIQAYWGVSYRDARKIGPNTYEFTIAKRYSFQLNTSVTYNVHIVFYSLDDSKEILKVMAASP